MEIGFITEDFNAGNGHFLPNDKRCDLYLFQNRRFEPTSVMCPLVWCDNSANEVDALDIMRSGGFIVTRAIAEVIMSFDPYGIECYPAQLTCNGDDTRDDRYFLNVNNIQDVVDQERTQQSTRFFLSEEKLKALPEHKRHVFRPLGMNQYYFSIELFDALANLARAGQIHTSLIAYTFYPSDEAPNL